MVSQSYEALKEDARKRSKAKSREGRDIWERFCELPEGNGPRRESCRLDLHRFFLTYFPEAFRLPSSPDQLENTALLQRVILDGGLVASAMPRGDGKTTRAVRAGIWALLYGHRRYPVLVGATDGKAVQLLRQIKRTLLTNDTLLEDFKWVCLPIRLVDGNGRLCGGQLFDGEHTNVQWEEGQLTLPTMPAWTVEGGLPNVSGSTVIVGGLTGALRGPAHVLPTGEVIRPDLAIIDDPQTRESAGSTTQTAQRREILQGDILGFAGPDQEMACIVTCTVIKDGDLADQLTDRQATPQFQGLRTGAVSKWPESQLWERYLELRSAGQRSGEGTASAQAFYAEHRAEMDAGAAVGWPERVPAGKLSAIQHFMDLRADIGAEAFASEYQNAPLKPQEEVERLTVEQICKQQGATAHGIAPYATAHVTAFVDVHDEILVWCVCAWAADFTGQVISYGAFPEQRTRHWQLRKADPALQTELRASSADAAIVAGLERLIGRLCGTAWPRDGGGEVKVSRLLVDRGYKPSLVHQAVKKLGLGDIVLPSNGFAVGAKNLPLEDRMSELSTAIQKDITGGWLIKRDSQRGFDKYARYETFRWKSFVYDRLACGFGETGALVLYKADPAEHRLFAEHLTAETTKPQIDERSGRRVVEWHMKENRADNHWFDCLVGCTVGAAMLGAVLEGMRVKAAEPIRTGRADADAKRREFIARRGY